ncbi:MAG: hypothetical protein KJP09_01715 [Bacteroidia bacterium]|nr:hypothetical protein [Bacteroidia bacterium]NND10841.1 hypothetical protein [Flavobacteriaceae bacterium]MBT8309372.1 hypothetical protein [Bacteroidia bacterium]NNK28618.1 hypothetical protein [Flavobacteriaceae bacterium]NNL60450.1 hypothetical protein [Flavobacteriaceae bacterium]
MSTDKELLAKGLKFMALALVLMFIGPTLLYIVFGDTESSTYIPLLIIGLFICIAAIAVAFKGIKTIMDSMFKKEN